MLEADYLVTSPSHRSFGSASRMTKGRAGVTRARMLDLPNCWRQRQDQRNRDVSSLPCLVSCEEFPLAEYSSRIWEIHISFFRDPSSETDNPLAVDLVTSSSSPQSRTVSKPVSTCALPWFVTGFSLGKCSPKALIVQEAILKTHMQNILGHRVIVIFKNIPFIFLALP